jgi:regulator of RNase E activity RraA
MKKKVLLVLVLVLAVYGIGAQQVIWQSDVIKKLTPEWTGERYPDGRPKVPDALLERLKNCAFEEIQAYLGMHGYRNVFENFASLYENGWYIIHPERVMTGRALTAQFMPMRPDFNNYVQAQAKEEGTHTPVTNYAPIIKLQEGDIYVADSYGKIEGGTLIGSNLGNAIARTSKRGVIYNGSLRDYEGLEAIGETFNGWIRGYDPSAIQQMMIAWINAPIRIGRVTILPGDAILAKKLGIAVIPPHLLQGCVVNSEYIALRDEFSFLCIRTNRFPYVNEAFDVDHDVYEKAFNEWLDSQKTPMTRQELDTYLKEMEELRKEMSKNMPRP